MKMMYYCDFMGNPEEEIRIIQRELYNCGLVQKKIDIIHMENPDYRDVSTFDVLFFDWGGMSLGNSMLDCFCRELLELAEENPSKLFVMTSSFTRLAMKDALESFGADHPRNIFLEIDENLIRLIKSGDHNA